jgi:hypothetical protein
MFKVKSIITDNGNSFTETTFDNYINLPNNFIQPLMCYLINNMEFFAEPNTNGLYTAQNGNKYNLIPYRDKNYIHEQSTPSTSWIIQHNLNKYPSINIIDTAGTEVYGAINRVNQNIAIIEFSAPFSGSAICN